MKKSLIIGGSPCAGKSSVSAQLSQYLKCKVINVDDYMFKHIEASDPNLQAILYQWKTKPWFKLFERPVAIQVEEEINFYRQEWDLLKKDILNEIGDEVAIIEGCALMPELAHTLFDHAHILYMVPEPSFQWEKYSDRTWAYEILKESQDPKDAFNKWMTRDIEFAKYIKEQAKEMDYYVITVDGNQTIEEIVEVIKEKYELY